MEYMDFPSAVEEIIAIQKKCELLRIEADEIANRTGKVSEFLCTLIGRTPPPKTSQNQDNVVSEEYNDNMTWRDIIINDLRKNGKSLVVDMVSRICAKKGIEDNEEKKKLINTMRTYLARFRHDGLVKSEEAEDQRLLWGLAT